MESGGSLAEQYLALIDEIVQQTLKGNIRSKEQVRSLVDQAVKRFTGEIFERSLATRISETEAQLESSLKAPRILRALKTIEGEWQKGLEDRQDANTVLAAANSLGEAPAAERSLVFATLLDPNQPNPLGRFQLNMLRRELGRMGGDLVPYQQGIIAGLASYERLEPELVSWLYGPATATVGFEDPNSGGPWPVWQKLSTGLPKLLFTVLA
ncbi:MAG: hypothetical protein DCF15_21150, partial [Phormidesmis priestleyi]